MRESHFAERGRKGEKEKRRKGGRRENKEHMRDMPRQYKKERSEKRGNINAEKAIRNINKH